MHVFGLVGGIASGKSLVAGMLADHGAEVIDADRIAHEVLATGDARNQIVERWGKDAMGADGEIDRRWLAERVFSDNPQAAGERRDLEAILHPAIGQRMTKRLQQFRTAGASAAVIDAPLLLEGGWGPHCDTLIFVASPDSARAERAAGRGWSSEDWQQREAAQMSLENKRGQADVVLHNDRDVDALRAEVAQIWQQRQGGNSNAPA